MYDKDTSFLDCNEILYKHQYGFRVKHSTIHPIIHLIDQCEEVTIINQKNHPGHAPLNVECRNIHLTGLSYTFYT